MSAVRLLPARRAPPVPPPALLAWALLAWTLLAWMPAAAAAPPSTPPAASGAAAAEAPSPTTPSPAGSTPAAGPATPAAAAGSTVQISDRAYAIAAKLRCPVCTAESVADSNAEIAGEMRLLIQQQLDAGKSQAQIIHYFRQRYGDWILLDPPKTGLRLLVWLLPLLALLAGVATLALLVRRWRAAADATPEAAGDDLRRVREALRAGEAARTREDER